MTDMVDIATRARSPAQEAWITAGRLLRSALVRLQASSNATVTIASTSATNTMPLE